MLFFYVLIIQWTNTNTDDVVDVLRFKNLFIFFCTIFVIVLVTHSKPNPELECYETCANYAYCADNIQTMDYSCKIMIDRCLECHQMFDMHNAYAYRT